MQDARDLSLQRRTSGAGEEASGEITPPMPSIVVRILVQKGDGVKKGQGPVVLRAMKMETILSAPRDGDLPFESAVDFLCEALGRAISTQDAMEGMKAFMEKREPRFTGK